MVWKVCQSNEKHRIQIKSGRPYIVHQTFKFRRVTTILVYVDNIIVTGNYEKERQTLRQCLTKKLEIKELGRLKYFLGIEVAHIFQQKYVTNLLKEIGKLACKPTSTPIDPNHKLGEAKEDVAIDKGMYQRLVGRLIYLSHTKPDIAYVVSVIN